MGSSTGLDHAKILAAEKSLEFVKDGMVVGLGSGSTATHFIKLLGEQVRRGLKIRGISSSRASEQLAKSLSIPTIDFHESTEIDVTIDGADEIGPGLNAIKGGGGALLREKIVASASRRFIIVADSRKTVEYLGKFPLPVEVIPMASPLVARKLMDMGIPCAVRKASNGSEYLTDEGNLILDCQCGKILDPDALARSIRDIVGVVEHGLFLHMAELALVASGSEVLVLHR